MQLTSLRGYRNPETLNLHLSPAKSLVLLNTCVVCCRRGRSSVLGCGPSGALQSGQNILFEPLDYGSAAIIKSEIAEVLKRYEPRISVDNIVCIPDEGSNGYEVELFFTIVGRDDAPVAVEFFLERTR